MRFEVAYQFGAYSGRRTVEADDGEEAKAKVRAWARNQRAMSMAFESYQVVGEDDGEMDSRGRHRRTA